MEPPPPQKKGQVSKENSRFVLLPGTPFLCVKLLSLIISIGAHRSRGGRHGAGCTGCRAVEGKKGKRLFYLRNYMRGEEEKEHLEISSSSRQSISSIIESGIFSQFSLRPKLDIANLNQYRVWQAAKKPLEKYANLHKEKRRRSAHLKIKRFPFLPFFENAKKKAFVSGRQTSRDFERQKQKIFSSLPGKLGAYVELGQGHA